MFDLPRLLIVCLSLAAVQALPQPQAAPVPALDTQADASFAKLLALPTAVRRFQALLTKNNDDGAELLTGDEMKKQTVFPFTPEPKEGVPVAPGGVTVAANVESFPILTNLGISTTLGFMNACGINTPHVHPRATEFLTLVEGENLRFGYVLENNIVAPGRNAEIAGNLKKFEGTVFPQGSIHFQFNDSCDRAVFVASLNSDDPGTLQVAQGFFALNSTVVGATLGPPDEINGQNIEVLRQVIPANLAQEIGICLARCNERQ